VVGVVGNTRDTTLAAPPSPTVYFPEVVQSDAPIKKPARTMALVVRTSGEPTSIISGVQRVVREIDPTLPTFDVRPMSDALRASTARLAFTILILAGAAVVTLTLGAVGLYGVMAYVVTLRRRELGIRIALGASPRAVAAATTRQGVALTSVGVVGGFVLFTGAARFMRTFLFGVAPWDPLTVVGATLTLFVVATLASWIPARRAGRVDPAEALRAE
jgi:ABC-type antimicrobial peptide transport system permease subunit